MILTIAQFKSIPLVEIEQWTLGQIKKEFAYLAIGKQMEQEFKEEKWKNSNLN